MGNGGSMMNDTAALQGFKAFQAGQTFDSNPYHYVEDLQSSWSFGFLYAMAFANCAATLEEAQ
jgi:hypothetical protein